MFGWLVETITIVFGFLERGLLVSEVCMER